MSTARTFSVFLLLTAAVLAWFYSSFLAGHACFFLFDLYAGWHPFLSYIGKRLRAGQLPMWNPYLLNGLSQISDPAPTVFYPFYLLFAPFSFSRALALVLSLQQLIAGAAMFALVRSFGWSRWAAAFGGACFALSGLMFSLQLTPTLMGTAAWLVVNWWALRRIDTPSPAGKLANTALACLCTYMAITGGVAEAFTVGLLLLAIVFLVEWWKAAGLNFAARFGPRAGLASFARFGRPLGRVSAVRGARRTSIVLALRLLALFTGALLTACVLLPAAEWSRISPRSIGLPLYEVFTWSANWYDYLCLAVPQPLGDLYDPFNPFRPLVAEAPNQTPYMASAFLGPVALTLAVYGLLDRRFRPRFYLLAFVVLACVVAAGSHVLPLVWLVKALKLRTFRFPIKALAFVNFGLCLFAARGMHVVAQDRWCEKTAAARAAGSAGTAVAAALWCAGVVAALVAQQVGTRNIELFGSEHLSPLRHSMILRCANNSMWTAGAGLLCCLVCRVVIRAGARQVKAEGARGSGAAPARQAAVALLVAAAVALFLLDARAFNYHAAPADFYSKPALVAEKVKQLTAPDGSLRRAAVLYDTPPPPKSAFEPGSRLIAVYQYARQMMSPATNMAQDIDGVLDFSVGQTADHSLLWQSALQQYSQFHNSRPLAVMCRMCSVKLLAAQLGSVNSRQQVTEHFPPPDASVFKPVYIDDRMNLALYAVQRPLPRAYFAAGVKWGRPHEAIRDFIAGAAKTGFDPLRLTVLEHTKVGEIGPRLDVSDEQLRASAVRWRLDAPEHIILEASSPTPNFLVLTDQYYPGWQARLDGKTTNLYCANVLFRAVLVPAGTHTVEFVYNPPTFRIGLALHLTGWLVVLLLLAGALCMRTFAKPR